MWVGISTPQTPPVLHRAMDEICIGSMSVGWIRFCWCGAWFFGAVVKIAIVPFLVCLIWFGLSLRLVRVRAGIGDVVRFGLVVILVPPLPKQNVRQGLESSNGKILQVPFLCVVGGIVC